MLTRHPYLATALLARGLGAPTAVFAISLGCTGVDLYETAPWIDIPLHFAGGAAIAYMAGSCRAVIKPLRDTASRDRVAIAATACAAVLWELFELASYVMFGMPEFLGTADTVGDLFFGLLGGSLFVYGSRTAGFRRSMAE